MVTRATRPEQRHDLTVPTVTDEVTTPLAELRCRWQRCRELLQQYVPEADGLLIFSRLNIYYFSGCFASGLLWLPLSGDPVLFCRRGRERAQIESPLRHIVDFNTYGDIPGGLQNLSMSLPTKIAAEMNGLSWNLSNSLTKRLPEYRFLPGDYCIALTRTIKSPWEMAILREAGARHNRCLTELLPPLLHQGMSELDIAHVISGLFFQQGHQGILRMENYGEEVFLGHIAVGDSANYPSVFNGPVGLRGVHPAAPFMGSDAVRWQPNTVLTVDNGFSMAGYQTDKTQVYWLGNPSDVPDAIHQAHHFCIDMQDKIAAQLKPGITPSRIWQQCLHTAENSPWARGFMGLGRNKVQFVGHGIGLAIDEYPVLADGFNLPLETGMVLAVEPKIGIAGVGMVGVENTFTVTTDGGRPLTGNRGGIICVTP